ncbi:MAG: hypothetical protein ACR2PL_14935 [Dehalococcoidia bacterium]
MSGWKKQVHQLKHDHGLTSKPGYKIFIADRGAVRFDIPVDWVVVPESDAIKFYNRPTPDDDCRLQLSVLHPPPELDWRTVSLTELFEYALKGDRTDLLTQGEIVHEQRQRLELVWSEGRLMDPIEHRESRSRQCLVNGSGVQAFMTLDYWPEDAGRFIPVWNEVLRTLVLGKYLELNSLIQNN